MTRGLAFDWLFRVLLMYLFPLIDGLLSPHFHWRVPIHKDLTERGFFWLLFFLHRHRLLSQFKFLMPFLAFPWGRVTIDLRSLPLDQLRVRVLHAFPRDFLFIFSYSHQKGYLEILVQLRWKVRKKLFPVRLVTGSVPYRLDKE